MTIAIEINNASVHYGAFAALSDVSMIVDEGRFVTIVGPNGGGKTTLFKLILGLVKPTRGHVRVLGMPPGDARASMGYVSQSPQFDALFPVRVCDVARMGCLGAGTGSRREAQERAMAALEAVGLADHAKHWFNSLSGGQKQRVLIARALAARPRILLLDEPTSNVDISAEDMILEVLEELRGKMTIMLVTHYPKVASRFLDLVYCVNHQVHQHPPSDSLDEDLMRHITGLAAPAVFNVNARGK